MTLASSWWVRVPVAYLAQVGILWGALEGFTYFREDNLKVILGGWWWLLYVLPLLTTAIYFATRKGDLMAGDSENIETHGVASPGKVGGSFSARINPAAMPQPVDQERKPVEGKEPATKDITTHGHYSPGEVKGDFTIE